MKFVLLLISLLCALIAMALAFDLLPNNDSLAEVNRLALAWLAASLASFVAAHVIGET